MGWCKATPVKYTSDRRGSQLHVAQWDFIMNAVEALPKTGQTYRLKFILIWDISPACVSLKWPTP
jgi:hypothetical protein